MIEDSLDHEKQTLFRDEELLFVKNVKPSISGYAALMDTIHSFMKKRIQVEHQYNSSLTTLIKELKAEEIKFMTKESDFMFNQLIYLFKNQASIINNAQQATRSIFTQLLTLINQYQAYLKQKYEQIDKKQKIVFEKKIQLQLFHERYQNSYMQLKQLQIEYLVMAIKKARNIELNEKKVQILEKQKDDFEGHKKKYVKNKKKMEEAIKGYVNESDSTAEVLENMDETLKGVFTNFVESYTKCVQNKFIDFMDLYSEVVSSVKNHETPRRMYSISMIDTIHQIQKSPNPIRNYIETVYNYSIDQNSLRDFLQFGIDAEQENSSIMESSFISEIDFPYEGIGHISQQQIAEVAEPFRYFFMKEGQFDKKHFMKIGDKIKNNKYLKRVLILLMENARSHQNSQVPSENIDNLVKIINIFLYQCLDEGDILNAKKMRFMAETLYFINEQGQQVRLLKRIMDHEIFHEEEFWIAVILMNCLQQKLKEKMNGGNKKKQEEVDRQNREMIEIKTNSKKNSKSSWEEQIYNQLATYIQYMKYQKVDKQRIERVFTKIVYAFGIQKNYKINALGISQVIDFNPNLDKHKNKMRIFHVLLGRKKKIND